MAENPSGSVLIIGSGPVALLTALEAHRQGIPVSLVEADFAAPPPPQNGELAFLGGEDALAPFFAHSLELWRNMASICGLPSPVPQKLLELATTPGRAEKLKQEAILEALGGESVTYTTTLPPYVNREKVAGAKSWPTAIQVAPGMMTLMQDAVAARGIPVYAAPVAVLNLTGALPLSLVLADGTELAAQHVVLASAPAAKRLLSTSGFSLPLRPARGQMLHFQTVLPEGMAQVVHRLKRGHLFLAPVTGQSLHAHYDALLDPLQATATPQADAALAGALAQHIGSLVPPLAGQMPVEVTPVVHWLTPDFMPALGPWQTQPALVLAVGFNGREMALAPAAAHQLGLYLSGEESHVFAPEFTPNRFATGLWSKVNVPGSLNWTEPSVAVQQVPASAPEYMSKVQVVEKAGAHYASNVKQTEKTIITAEKKPSEMRERHSKPRIQTASLK